ncbi:MAG: hypothetical protein ABR600_03490 [Actinomycetota bacterium]
MGELGRVVELMQSARQRYRTLYVEVRSYARMDLFVEAMKRSVERQPYKSALILTPNGDVDDEPPTEREGTGRLWVENPSRYRVELRSSGDPPWVEVGRRPWLETPRPETYPIPPDTLGLEEIYDPGLLIAELWLEPAGGGTVAGREGIVVRASPRPTLRAGGMEFLHLDPVLADAYELVIDAERGIVLRLEARVGGELMDLTEVTHVAFDEPIPDELLQG